MARGIFAFYAAHMPNTLNTIKSYSATFRMPFVTSGMAVNTSRQEVAYELYVRPQYSRALRDIIIKYGWNEIWYLYSSNEGSYRTQQAVSLSAYGVLSGFASGWWRDALHPICLSQACSHRGLGSCPFPQFVLCPNTTLTATILRRA